MHHSISREVLTQCSQALQAQSTLYGHLCQVLTQLMKRLFLGVFGGFCAVIMLIGVFNFYHFSAIHTYQEGIVKTDRIALHLQRHKEQFQSFGQHDALIDSVAAALPEWRHKTESFWKSTTGLMMRNQFSLLQQGLPVYEEFAGRRQLSDLERTELELMQTASQIGFKEHGLIGRMRTIAHSIEKNAPQFNERLLSLRRHEKDFLMRVDPHYSDRFKEEYIAWKGHFPFPAELDRYAATFDSLQDDYLQLYQAGNRGLFALWQNRYEALQEDVRKQRSLLLSASFKASSKAQTLNFVLNTTAIILAIACSVFLARMFARQVRHLQQTMAQYIATNYQFTQDTALRIPKNDFGKITLHFLQLTRKIRADMQLLEDRVQRRTKSLQLKNQQLESQHREIMDSLRYAQNLQQSLLVSRSKMLRSFREAWVYYQPKNLVGGDFYWMKEVNDGSGQLIYFALADCTGHGVPGALLSVMGMNALDELIDAGIRQPAALLNELRALVSRRLNTHEDKRHDGMDMALIVWNKTTHSLTFSGAQMPLWIIREGRLVEFSGQRMPIGYTHFEVTTFVDSVIPLLPNDRLILFSDGIIDQFGGLNDKKLGKKMLREWLKMHRDDASAALFSKLVQQFEFWKGNSEQTDDCTLLLLEPQIIPVEQEKQFSRKLARIVR